MKINKALSQNIFIIIHYTGFIIIGVSLLMVIPLIFSIIFKEINPILDFLISINISLILGISMVIIGKCYIKSKIKMQWRHGFVIASLSWIY